MSISTAKKLFGILVLTLLMLFGVTSVAMGQGRGRGHNGSHLDRKCEKFVNCHDARDGRWDGRGPRRNVDFTNSFRRHRRSHNWDDNGRHWRYRRHDFDHNRSRRYRR